jgi:putative flippase GtrA
MNPECSSLIRWLKFNAVGAIGICVQLCILALLQTGFRVNYLIATMLAVEAAVLHNFFWHERFTWKDRSSHETVRRLLRFNSSNGAISILGNLVLMKLLVDAAGLHYLIANLISITVCSLANFFASDRSVFTAAAQRQSS